MCFIMISHVVCVITSECSDASTGNKIRDCAPVCFKDQISGKYVYYVQKRTTYITLHYAQMVDMLHRAMELKNSSEFLLQKEAEDVSVKPLERISSLKSELDFLASQSRKYVNFYHLFAKIPSSKRSYS